MLKYPAFVVIAFSLVSAQRSTVETVAGNGSPENNGDQGVATEVAVQDPFGVEIGPDGALYITEVGHHRIRRVDLKTNRISTVAGTGKKGYSGDGGLATQANLNEPYELRFDQAGNMFFVEMQNHIIRRVDAKTKRISTIAGTGKAGFSGDGGPATNATFNRPHSIALDQTGNLYVADIGNHRIRYINLETGVVETIAGTGEKTLPVDGQIGKGVPMLGPRALYVTGDTLWIALREGNSVWKMNMKSGVLAHVAGSGEKGLDDGSADKSTLNGPKGIVVDHDNNVFVVDTENHVIRRIDGDTQVVTTIAGNGRPGSSDGEALNAQLNRPHGICLDRDGSLFVGDTLNHRAVRITE
jgi:streptogramin lyase